MRMSNCFINRCKKDGKGFTLVELLAVISVLSLVLGLVVYVAINVIDNAKKKSYETTINNVEKIAGDYLIENSDRLFYLKDKDGKYEYQCLTVQNLIDMDFLDNNITASVIGKDNDNQDIHVSKEDYIYIERDINSKAITKNVLINKYQESDNELYNEYVDICGFAVRAMGIVDFLVTPSEWSSYKDVTINYRLKNLNDINTLNDYTYEYKTSLSDYQLVEGNTKKITVNENMSLSGRIWYKKGTSYEEILAQETKVINNIDKTGPIISLVDDTTRYVKDSVVIPIKVTDSESGVDYNSFTTSDITVTVDGNKVSDILLDRCSDEGICNLTVNNNLYEGEVVIHINEDSIFDKIVDDTKNGNDDTILNPNIRFDMTKPTCETSKSNLDTQEGVTVTITCSDNSGICNVPDNNITKVKTGTHNYTVTDEAGNINTCSVTVSGYDCNPYQYACGSYACGSYACGSYECGSYACGTGGGYSCACGDYGNGYACSWCYAILYCPQYCTAYCTSYCTSYCTAYNTCYE